MNKPESPTQVGQAEMLAVEFLRWVLEIYERVPVQIVSILEAKIVRSNRSFSSMRSFPPKELRQVKVKVILLPCYHNPGDHIPLESPVYTGTIYGETVLLEAVVLIDQEGGFPCILTNYVFNVRVKGSSLNPLRIMGELLWHVVVKLAVKKGYRLGMPIVEIGVCNVDKTTRKPRRWVIRTSYRDEGRTEVGNPLEIK